MKSIQCARGLAALLVVYFHAVLQVGNLSLGTPHLPLFGRCGVDIFFVLSGFIIWTSTQRSTMTPTDFMVKRFLRIVPLYWLLTATAALISVLAPTVLRSTRFEWHHVLASLFFVPWPNPASSGSPADLMTPVIVPGWTLNFEIAFYGLFALSLLSSARTRFAALALVFVTAATAMAVLGRRFPSLDFYDPLLFAEFFCGVMIGAAPAAGRALGVGTAMILLVLAVYVLVGLDAADVPVHRFFTAGLPAAVIIAMAVRLDAPTSRVRLRPMVALGDASFSLYLVHIFVLTGLRIAWQHALGGVTGLGQEIAFLALAVTFACLAAALTYRYVERPIGRRLQHWTARGAVERGRLPTLEAEAPRRPQRAPLRDAA